MTPPFPPEVVMESAPCNHCGTAEERVLFEGPDLLHALPGLFRVVECPNCGWIRQNPRPTHDTIGYYYPEDYVNFVAAIEDEPTQLKHWDRRYGMIKRRRVIERLHPAKGRLLDVGCGTGSFLREMQCAGWDTVGVEPAPKAAAYTQQRFAIPVHTGTLREAHLPEASFDVITLWDVLEHLHTPWDDLQEIARLLAPGGLLVLRHPNLNSLGKRIFGTLWLGWDQPRHLYLYPHSVLAKSLAQLNFEIADVRCIAGAYPNFMMSVRISLNSKFPRARWTSWLTKLSNSLPVRLVTWPLFWLIGKLRLADNYTLFARKCVAHHEKQTL